MTISSGLANQCKLFYGLLYNVLLAWLYRYVCNKRKNKMYFIVLLSHVYEQYYWNHGAGSRHDRISGDAATGTNDILQWLLQWIGRRKEAWQVRQIYTKWTRLWCRRADSVSEHEERQMYLGLSRTTDSDHNECMADDVYIAETADGTAAVGW